MVKRTTRIRRDDFYAWVRWAPLVLIVVGVLFSDAWLNLQMVNLDYAYGRLKTQYDALVGQLDDLRVEEARLQSLDRLAEWAEEMGFSEPDPGQIEVIAPETPVVIAVASEAEMSRLALAWASRMTTPAPVITPPQIIARATPHPVEKAFFLHGPAAIPAGNGEAGSVINRTEMEIEEEDGGEVFAAVDQEPALALPSAARFETALAATAEEADHAAAAEAPEPPKPRERKPLPLPEDDVVLMIPEGNEARDLELDAELDALLGEL